MAGWRIVGGPSEYDMGRDGADIDIGWAYDIGRDGEQRSIRVEVAGGRLGSASLPDECQRAIQTWGRSAVEAVLDRSDPPIRIIVASTGLSEANE